MEKIILYGSKYGSSRKYAEMLSASCNIKTISYEQASHLENMDKIIYIGSLYAGGVFGLSKFLRRFTIKDHQQFFLITVGLADPNIEENRIHLRQTLRKQYGHDFFEHSNIFHLRGSIDYQQLSFKDKTLMTLLYKSLSKKPADRLSTEDRALIETYDKKVDFIDYDALRPIIREIQI